MIRQKDVPYIKAIKELTEAHSEVTSNQIDQAVMDTNAKTGIYYTSQQVINLMAFCQVIVIESHLGQPRHGQQIGGGRLHKIQVLWNG